MVRGRRRRQTVAGVSMTPRPRAQRVSRPPTRCPTGLGERAHARPHLPPRSRSSRGKKRCRFRARAPARPAALSQRREARPAGRGTARRRRGWRPRATRLVLEGTRLSVAKETSASPRSVAMRVARRDAPPAPGDGDVRSLRAAAAASPASAARRRAPSSPRTARARARRRRRAPRRPLRRQRWRRRKTPLMSLRHEKRIGERFRARRRRAAPRRPRSPPRAAANAAEEHSLAQTRVERHRFQRATRPRRLPTRTSRAETRRALATSSCRAKAGPRGYPGTRIRRRPGKKTTRQTRRRRARARARARRARRRPRGARTPSPRRPRPSRWRGRPRSPCARVSPAEASQPRRAFAATRRARRLAGRPSRLVPRAHHVERGSPRAPGDALVEEVRRARHGRAQELRGAPRSPQRAPAAKPPGRFSASFAADDAEKSAAATAATHASCAFRLGAPAPPTRAPRTRWSSARSARPPSTTPRPRRRARRSRAPRPRRRRRAPSRASPPSPSRLEPSSSTRSARRARHRRVRGADPEPATEARRETREARRLTRATRWTFSCSRSERVRSGTRSWVQASCALSRLERRPDGLRPARDDGGDGRAHRAHRASRRTTPPSFPRDVSAGVFFVARRKHASIVRRHLSARVR